MHLPCPHCGTRPITEFLYGELTSVPDSIAEEDARDVDRAFMRNNPQGVQTERIIDFDWRTCGINGCMSETGRVEHPDARGWKLAERRKIIALISQNSDTAAMLQAAASERGFTLAQRPDANNIVAWLAMQQPELVLVDVEASENSWVPSVIAIKTSPATRKLTMLAFGADAGALERARACGCDATWVTDDQTNFGDLISSRARGDDGAELLRQSALPLPARALRGMAEFNAGQYYEQHESFEHCWRAEPGPVRALYQAVLQVGVAYHQIQRGNYNGAHKMFLRAQQYLAVLPDVCQTIDVAQLRADSAAAFDALERVGAQHIAGYDQRLLKPIQHAY